jgi:hypothetical protein
MPADSALTLDEARRAAQLALLARGAEVEVGALDGWPWTPEQLAGTAPAGLPVACTVDDGLTARVHRLEHDGRAWALKRARAHALVRNDDGRTSFLNEVQRRADLERLKAAPGGQRRWAAMVDTCWASLRHGVILSPWIDGAAVAPEAWDERRLAQVLQALADLWLEGLFEWDPSPGNLLDDGRQVRLFDFGYCYRFDPLCQFNSAGRGADLLLFHPIERFETRTYSAVLLALEQGPGPAAALAAFRREKTIALETVCRMHSCSAARGAAPHVLQWLAVLAARWREALAPGGDLLGLYRVENWRSHALDLDDDLQGRSCTRTTLRRADWLLATLATDLDRLRAAGALFFGDERRDDTALRAHYCARRAQAQAWQVRD